MIILLSAFFLTFTYYSQLNQVEKQRTQLLLAIASGAAAAIDGDDHQALIERHPLIDDVRKLRDDSTYFEMHNVLYDFQHINKLHSSIYTLVYDSTMLCFRYVVRSDSKVYYLHNYKVFPDDLRTHFNEGGVLEPYMTENGYWISAFYPIRNSKGEAVGLVQADEEFERFITGVNRRFQRYMIVCLIVIVVLTVSLIPLVRRMLLKDEKLFRQLQEQKSQLERANKDLSDSVNYASSIQRTIFPSRESMNHCFSDHFVLNLPKDIVSGDFYWLHREPDCCYLAVSDCTGHGVPGAMMSMMGITLLNGIVQEKDCPSATQVLTQLDQEVDRLLSNQKVTHHYDGMDIALLRIEPAKKHLEFSGAMTGILLVKPDGSHEYIKGNRFPIGGRSLYNKSEFKAIGRNYSSGSWLYLFSDGYEDQFGGEKDKKYTRKRFIRTILENRELPPMDQLNALKINLYNWRGKGDQIDDILVVGIRLD